MTRLHRSRRRRAGAIACITAAAALTPAAAQASCPLPEGSTVLAETNFLRVIEQPGPGDPLANLVACLHSTGTRYTLASRYASKHGKGSYALIGTGYTFVGFRVRVTDRSGRVDSSDQVVNLRATGEPQGGGARAEKVIDLPGNRIAWTSVEYAKDGKARRYVRAAGPRGARRLASGKGIALHRLTAKGRRVYWRQDGHRHSALVA